MKILIKNATVVNHDEMFDADVLIQNSKIAKVDKNLKEKAEKEIDAKNKFLMPAFIDMHTHLRVPGREDEEDFFSGSMAAAKGGFSTILCMPNTNPCIDNEGLVKWIIEEAQRVGLVDIIPVGAITRHREGKILSEAGTLKRSGCLALSDDGNSVENSALFKRALEYAKMVDLLIISHCEDRHLTDVGAMRESFVSSKYGINSIPDISETVRLYRDIELAKYLNARLHIAHLSCAKSIELLRREKEKLPYLSCETAPHYFALTVEDIEKSNFNSNFKVSPPLGEKKDLETIKEALREGVIDCIATDHAPHSVAEKELPFEEAPFGFIGLELAFSLSYKHLVKEDVLDLKGLVEKLSVNPARILRLTDRGKIKKGFLADLVIVDLERTWQVAEETLVSKSKNTPFMGSTLDGLVQYTIHKGKIVYKNV